MPEPLTKLPPCFPYFGNLPSLRTPSRVLGMIGTRAVGNHEELGRACLTDGSDDTALGVPGVQRPLMIDWASPFGSAMIFIVDGTNARNASPAVAGLSLVCCSPVTFGIKIAWIGRLFTNRPLSSLS